MPNEATQIFDLLTELWNTGHTDLVTQLFSERTERIDPNLSRPVQGRQAVADYVNAVRSGFSDFKLDFRSRIVDNNQAVSEWVATGTHDGNFLGIPATGRSIEVPGVTLHRLEEGKIVEERVYFDRITLIQQLGFGAQQSRAAGAEG